MRRGSATAGEGQKRDDVEGVEDDVGSAAVDGKTQAIPEAVSQLSHHVQLPRRLIYPSSQRHRLLLPSSSASMLSSPHIMMLILYIVVVDCAHNYSTVSTCPWSSPNLH